MMDSHIHMLPFAFLIFLMLLPLHAMPRPSDERYSRCSKLRTCGRFDITYPFWEIGEEEFCGHPGYGIECEDDNLTLAIGNNTYQVLNITKENQSMIIVKVDILQSNNCPAEPTSPFIFDHRFNLTDNDSNATLLFSCSPQVRALPQLHEFGCSLFHHHGLGDYLLSNLTDQQQYDFLKSNCHTNVMIPMLKSAAQDLTDSKTDAAEALEEGFEVSWRTLINASECLACLNSSGACGYNASLHEFSCFCIDGAHQGTCPGPLQQKAPSAIPISLAVTCPMDLSYVRTIPWDTSSCRNHATNSSSPPETDPCCITLLSLYGIAFAQRLKETNFFMLPDLDTSVSCLQSFQSKLEDLDLPTDISSFCFVPNQFVVSENTCASIKNSTDLVSRLEGSTAFTKLKSSCRSNLKDQSNCKSCITSAFLVKDALLALDGEDDPDSLARECYFFAILYAAGIINSLDPSNHAVLTCILSLPLNTGGKSGWRVKLRIGLGAVGGTAFVMSLAFFIFTRYRRKQKPTSYVVSRSISSHYSSRMDYERGGEYYGLPIFEYDELRSATNNFDPDKELGDGGFGTVFYGKLKDGRVVAVKRLYENNYKRTEQFINEVEILARLHHPNLVRLYGCTSRLSNRLLLVYEYVPNGTVADHLHGDLAKPGSLPWSIRMNIAVETASALVYLHASEIIHRDVKTTNILLDENFKVKVADFGLSRLFPLNATHVSTAPQGTPGYVDPEYHECYQLTEKSDVYSFGVVLMELISSLPAVDIMRHRHEINLSTMAINKIQNDAIHELVDKNLGFGSDDNVTRMIMAIAELGFQCLQNGKDMRPSMAEVLEVLQNIQKEDPAGAEIKDVHSDVAALLKVDSSPVSVTAKWVSSENTTPNLSG